jgi:hypothetical protein
MSNNFFSEGNINEGKFSLVQLNIPSTYETFNIGVIFQESENNNQHFKFIDNFDKLSKCLRIKEIGNIKYTIELLQDRINNNELVGGNISRSINISAPQIFTYYSDDFESEFNKLFMKKVSLASETLVHKKDISKRTKTEIISNIDTAIIKKDYSKIIQTRKYLTTIFGEQKEFDTVSYVNANPAIIAEVVSLDVDFFNQYSKSISLLKLVANNNIQERILYAPIFDKNVVKFNEKKKALSDSARDNGFTFLDTKYPEEFIGYIYDKTNTLAL